VPYPDLSEDKTPESYEDFLGLDGPWYDMTVGQAMLAVRHAS
jgi:hypothetical protein